jgi:hypothetical protein
MDLKKPLLLCLIFVSAFCMEKSLEERIAILTEKIERLELSDPNDYLVFFDVLYWHPKTDLTEVGGDELRVSSRIESDGSHTPYADFNWSFGFRTGMGYVFPERGWDVVLKYTRLTFNDNFSDNPGSLRRVISNFGKAQSSDPVAFVKGSHRIDYQAVNAELGKKFVIDANFLFHPVFGVQAIWINQLPHIINQAEGGNTLNIAQHTAISEKSVGVGPLTKIYSSWCFCGGWSIYGDGGFSLLFTRYRGHMDIEGEAGDPDLYWSNKETKHYVVPNLSLSIGIGYERMLQSQNQISLSLGYESQMYFNQSYLMQTRRVQEPEQPQGAWFSRNLSLYGVTASVTIDF